MDKLLPVQELVEQSAAYFDYPSLARCVRVSRSWNTALIPILWSSFGTDPTIPTRFGVAHAPGRGWFSPQPKFPLQVTDPRNPSSTIPALAVADPKLYPILDEKVYLDKKAKKSLWRKLFAGHPLASKEQETLHNILAKYGHFIRCLTIRLPDAVCLLQPYCTELKALYCRFDKNWKKPYGRRPELLQAIERTIIQLVTQQTNLDSLHLMNGLVNPNELRSLVVNTKERHWKHINFNLCEQDYRDVVWWLPHLESGYFVVESSHTATTPLLNGPHTHLRELEITLPYFTVDIFQNLLQSFPNLDRLVVSVYAVCLDLVIDRKAGRCMLYSVNDFHRGDEYGFARILQLLPYPLLVLHCGYMHSKCLRDVLPRFGQHLVHLRVDRMKEAYGTVEHFDEYDENATIPPPALNRVLASCPELRTVIVVEGYIHAQHIMDEAWICHKLEHLHIWVIGLPRIRTRYEERRLYNSVYKRWPQLLSGEIQVADLTAREIVMVRKISLRFQYRDVFENQIQQCPQLGISTYMEEGFQIVWKDQAPRLSSWSTLKYSY
ncbi:hypothetical protein BGX28_007737 [Mortierella sp. GBA30]|nr:hypothetical protein BGX28_007737 [Mortierella sp. GBA30]